MELDRQRRPRKTLREILATEQVVAALHLPAPQVTAHPRPLRQPHPHQLRPQVEDLVWDCH